LQRQVNPPENWKCMHGTGSGVAYLAAISSATVLVRPNILSGLFRLVGRAADTDKGRVS